MSLSYWYFALSGLFNAVVSTLLGIFIYRKNKKSKVNITFSLFCLGVAAWSYPYIFWPLSSTAAGTLLSFQLLHLGACFVSIFYLHFVTSWLGLEKQNKIILIVGYIFSILFASTVFSPLFIRNMAPKFQMRFWADPGILYHFFLLMFFGIMVYSSYLLYHSYKNLSGVKKIQCKYILIGFILSFLGGSTNYFLWYDINIPPYGNILGSSFVILTAYAIVVHRFMDLKFVFRKYTVFFVSLICIFIPAIIVRSLEEKFFPEYSIWLDLTILVLAIAVFQPLKDYFYKLANKYFFSSLYDSRQVIASISEKLRSTLDVERIYEMISETLTSSFHIKSFGLLTYEEASREYYIKYNKDFPIGNKKVFEGDEDLHKLFIKHNKAIIMEELKHSNIKLGKHAQQTVAMLMKLGVEIISPLNIKDKTIGLIALGAKESGDMYNDEDLQVLEIIGAQTAIALENALLYNETKDFNIKLEAEVHRATRDLRQANEKLKELDKAKSDFISIASHQLRTPLTVIKGYISMILENNFGDLTDNERGALEKVYESNERLIQLVENLLNLSRIESGRLQYNFAPASLAKITESVIDELIGTAMKKGLKLQYKKADTKIEDSSMDEEKIRQVVMNLIDNAIKYTKKGTISISLERKDEILRFCVNDSGMGISEEELPNLFRRFVRGTGTSLVHTEGTGLGLYVARKMIEAHSGKIWAESKGRDTGAKFCFWIPVK